VKDSVIYERLAEDSLYRVETEQHLEDFAIIGLRTLCFARATISEQTYAAWSKEYYVASIALNKREQKLADVAEKIEQVSLSLSSVILLNDALQNASIM
jgi:phospholipid-transporting ATPase